nr:hypothetical protein [uncultured Dorea sp.]
MSRNSLAELYLSNSKFSASINTFVSTLNDTMRKTHYDEFSSLSACYIEQLSKLSVPPTLRLDLTSCIIGNSVTSSVISASANVMKELLQDATVPSISLSNDDFVIVDQEIIKEYEFPETIAIPIGHNRAKIKFETLISIIGIIISIFSALPSKSEQEQIALQKAEVQILSQILENTESTSPETSEELNALNEAVDGLNSRVANIEQYQKESSQSGKNGITNK